MDYKELKSLVAKNKFDQVFTTLNQGIPEDEAELIEELSIVEGAYDAFKKKERLGLLSNSETITERSKVAMSVITLIGTVKKKLN